MRGWWKRKGRVWRVYSASGKPATGRRLVASIRPRRRRIDEEIRYLEAGRERMDYARFERDGWPIGSGAVEGTCKHLVKERFCVTGAQWRRKNIPKLLALRQSIFNGEWDQDWKYENAA